MNANDELTSSTAFILPQRGGIFIYNPPTHLNDFQFSVEDLRPAMLTFRAQLLALLGVPTLPQGIHSAELISDWQLDAVLRQRASENVQMSKDTMVSIVKLVDQIEGMPVGSDVQADINDALDALEQVSGVLQYTNLILLVTRHIRLPQSLLSPRSPMAVRQWLSHPARSSIQGCLRCFISRRNTNWRSMHVYLRRQVYRWLLP